MKLVVIGGVTGGASAAARARRLDAKSEIIIFERGEHVSFSNCCLPYYLSETVPSSDSLILMNPIRFKQQHDIDVRVKSEVVRIDREKKTVTVKNLITGKIYEETYDKLILSPGAHPILPKNISGIDQPNVFTIRNVSDIKALKNFVDLPTTKELVVVGGGFIGVETAENLKKAGKSVCLIEGASQIMTPFDNDMVQILHKELDDNGIHLYLSSTLTAVEKNQVQIVQGKKELTIPADGVIMAIGVAPEVDLAVAAGLELGKTKAIRVNHNYQTNDPDIYAVGDAVEVYNALTHSPGRLALAGPAQRQARAVADHIYHISHNNKGYIGSSCIRVFQQNAAATGLSEKAAKAAGYSYDSVLIFPVDKVSLMPGSHYMALKLIFETPTGRILGAQAIGQGEVNKRIDVIATMIAMNGTLEDLKELELCYSPVFGTAKDAVNFAALVGLNVLYGRYHQVHLEEVRNLVESGAYIMDVREEQEYAAGHLNGAHNIPLSQLRQRMHEIPKDVPVYLHCRSSQRSYYAICCLQGNGYSNLYNISGSYLGISLYEYYQDKISGREPILDHYNFV